MRRGPFLSSKLWAGVENSTSLFMFRMVSSPFQCKCLLFCILIALVPVLMWVRMVHSIPPPLLGSSCQLHSKLSRSLRASLYMRIFSSSSNSRHWVRSSSAEACVHPSSGGPAILMLNRRFGGAWFLKQTRISF